MSAAVVATSASTGTNDAHGWSAARDRPRCRRRGRVAGAAPPPPPAAPDRLGACARAARPRALGRRRPAAQARQRPGAARRRSGRAAAARGGAPASAVARPPRRLVRVALLPARGRRAAHGGEDAAGGARGARRRPCPAVGGIAVAAVPSRPAGRRRRPARARARDAHPGRDRLQGAADALPPREDRRDRRSRGLRRRDRPDDTRAATASTPPATAREGDSAGTTRPPRCAARPWRTSPTTSGCAGRRSRARRCRRRSRSAAQARSSCSSCGRCPRTSTRRCRDGDFRILEAYTRALRSARRLVYLENQFFWSPEIVEILERKLRNPPSDDFRVLVLLPASRTTAATTREGSSEI